MKIYFLKRSFATLLGLALYIPAVQAEDSFFSWAISPWRMKGVAVVNNAEYQEECGACHFPYPPGLLPERSWRQLLDTKALQDHFGDNAELNDAVRLRLLDLVVTNAAEKSWYKRSRKLMASLDDDVIPQRITETLYIKEKHEDIPLETLRRPSIKSLSHCDKCHTGASRGVYDDDTVVIPK
ncbi:MAG: diheme cytochrome c [Gammaproteobacteria bacterium]|nr:diheme cytochrome c [Gammaproteobacteria bacterium]